jgi:hypothetical protein
MQHIKTYMAKIDQMIKSKQMPKPKKSKDAPTAPDTDKNIRIIASLVQGIRESRKETLNGDK